MNYSESEINPESLLHFGLCCCVTHLKREKKRQRKVHFLFFLSVVLSELDDVFVYDGSFKKTKKQLNPMYFMQI